MLVLPSKELLSEVLQVNVSEVYARKNEIRFRTHVDTLDGWTRNSDVPLSNIYELAFRTREYLKTKSKHLSLNQSIDDIFKEANDIYESLSK